MNKRAQLRFRVRESGALEVVDPSWDCLDLIKTIDPSFKLRWKPLKGFSIPRFIKARSIGCGHSLKEIKEMSLTRLWAVHNNCLEVFNSGIGQLPKYNEASLLHLKIELVWRILSNCTFCAHRCGVDRTSGQMGLCKLGTGAKVAEYFVHIGEENIINPSLILNLIGCGLRCVYCQQGSLLDPAQVDGEPLEEFLWEKFDTDKARSISFAGGNPDESIFSILRFLISAPKDWDLPVVWNCHGYTTPEVLAILEGLVDVWLPDYKYGNKLCGQNLSGVNHYPDVAQEAVKAMLDQSIPVIVRILLLPGHSKCCHLPVLESLADMPHKNNILISIRDQYCPDWFINCKNRTLNRRVTEKESSTIIARAKALGFTLINN